MSFALKEGLQQSVCGDTDAADDLRRERKRVQIGTDPAVDLAEKPAVDRAGSAAFGEVVTIPTTGCR
jgi:hypothetical protein